ncbi:low molecular weight protein-tyrosine-phosphatase [Chryseobacterium koreense]
MKLLMVCLGNICRSPLAEGILKSKLPDHFTVDSAGTISLHEGEQPDKRGLEIARTHGIDISGQRSRPITNRDLLDFDKIYCMDLRVYEEVVSMAKDEEQRKKISLFLESAGETGDNLEVFDPYWSGMDQWEEVYQVLDQACSVIAEKLTIKSS